MSDSMMSLTDVLQIVPVSKNTIHKTAKTGRFPKPVPISVNRRCWYRSEVNAWIASLHDPDVKEGTRSPLCATPAHWTVHHTPRVCGSVSAQRLAFDGNQPLSRIGTKPRQIVDVLQSQPHVGAGLEVAFKAQRHFWRDGTMTIDNLGDRFAADTKQLGGVGDTQAHLVQHLLLEDFTGMRGGEHTHSSIFHFCYELVIIFVVHQLDVSINKSKGDAPVGPHGYRPVAIPVAREGVQVETGQVSVTGHGGHVEHGKNVLQFLHMFGLNTTSVTLFIKDLKSFVFKALDHTTKCNLSGYTVQPNGFPWKVAP